MFSEYASRFLAQSQSRISFLQPDAANESSRNPLSRERGRNGGNSRFPTAGSYQRPSLGNPYRPTTGHFSQFPFASRTSAAPAPLFYSATDEFQEDDEETEREREAADFYALQRSRRHFGASRLEESSEADDDGPDSDADADTRGTDDRGFRRGRGIRSSWRGDRSKVKKKGASSDPLARHSEGSSDRSSKDKGRMVDVGLESMINESIEPLEHPSEDLAIEMPSDENPPPFQQFRKPPSVAASVYDRDPPFLPYHNDTEADLGRQPRSSDDDSVPPTISYPTDVPPKHDSFWASLFLICLTSLFATFFLVYLHTSAPSRKHPLGDTIYTVLHSSFHLLAVDTLVAVIVSLVWLSLLRSFVRPLVYLILIAAPVILTSFAIYPLVASYKGAYKGASLQDKAMRWFSLIPAVAAVLWTYSVYKARHSFHKAIGILEFACRILAANPALLALGFGTLAGVVLWTWIWMGMFTRVFLGGHLSPSRHLFIIDTGSWWLGVYFVLTYLWTLAVGRGIQRAATAATVSQWYFHRLAVPAPSSRQV
ncbi:MAG: hypothetical protein M1817_004700, partial [Caeruleum heppii]